FTFSSGVNLGAVSVVTEGAAGLDFSNAGSGTCVSGNSYTAGQACTVDVRFAPQSPGVRFGAVSLADPAGKFVASAMLSGTGTGPQIAFNPGSPVALDPMVNGHTLSGPFGVAVDAAGNLYIADPRNSRVVEIPAGNGAPVSIDPVVNGRGLAEPGGVAVDGAGDLYISDLTRDLIVEIPADGRAPIAIAPVVNGKGLAYPCGMGFDKSNNLYVADVDNARVIEIPANGASPAVIDPMVDGRPLIYPVTVALDGEDNLYIADYMANRIVEVPAAGGAPAAIAPSVDGKSLDWPYGIAVDAAGDLYIADADNRVMEAPAGGSAPIALNTAANGTGLNNPIGIALDSAGNLYVGDEYNDRVVEVRRAQLPGLNFAAAAPGSASADSPQTIAVEDIGNGALSFPAPAAGTNPALAPNFQLDSSGPPVCPLLVPASPSPNVLDAGASCTLPIGFVPNSTGAVFGSLTLTDDSLNVASTQTAPLSGNAPAASISTPMMAFGPQQLQTQSATQQVTLANTGSAALAIQGISVSGAGGTAFVFTNSCGSSLAAGSHCAIQGYFDPATPGAIAATLQISDSASGSPQQLSLTGSGVYPVTLTVTPSPASMTTAQALQVFVEASGPAGQPVPTGSVAVTVGGFNSATSELGGGTATLPFAAGSLAVGTDAISAVYTPDSASLNQYAAASASSDVSVTAAPTAVAPSATTGSASAIASTAAVVSGLVDPAGADTRAWFVYGTSSTLAGASQTPSQDIGSATGLDPVSATLSGLASDATYYYQLVAQNSLGTSFGGIQSFSTAEGPYFSVIAGAPIAIAPGATTGNTSLITVLPLNGFVGTVNLSCAISAAATGASPTCAIPSPVTVQDSAVTASLTVNTTGAAARNAVPEVFRRCGEIAVALLLLGLPLGRGRRLLVFGVLLVAIAGVTACGSGSVNNAIKAQGTSGTPQGNYTVTITAVSGSLTETANLAVTVQ
ncbi:MAG: choice-of-anchor D domain-containing protein, partial [Acidobacteriota bacterium]